MTTTTRDLCIMACIFCRDPQFQSWADSIGERRVAGDDGAKGFILDTCGVTSRNVLDTDKAAAERFHENIRKPFLAWKEAQQPEAAPARCTCPSGDGSLTWPCPSHQPRGVGE